MSNGGCMAKSDSKIVAVCDAGPIIHLDELNCLDLLSNFHSLLIPKAVQREVEKHRFTALQHPRIIFKTIDVVSHPEPKLLVLSKALLLDKGELESLSLIQENPEAIFLTDDAAARLAGEELGYKVHGTIGIILRAIRKKIKTPKEVVELLNEIPTKTTLFLKPELLQEIILEIKE